MPDPDQDISSLRDDIEGLRAILMQRHESIPPKAQWTLDEARVRLSHGLNAKALSEEELEAWLEDDRTMSNYALRKLRLDETCPIRAISVSGDVKRIPEPLIRRHLEGRREDSRPESMRQIA